jgi:hypothetical protein
VTFVYGARDEEHNGAVALKEYVEETTRSKRRPKASSETKGKEPAA